MPKFTITQMLLVVTWCGIASYVVARHLDRPNPFTGDVSDLVSHQGQTLTNNWAQNTIDSKLIDQSPTWHLDNESPPVSPRDALQIANDIFSKRLENSAQYRWGLELLTLYPIDFSAHKWCWRIVFTANLVPKKGVLQGSSGVPPQYTVFVLMDGKVVELDSKYNEPLIKMGLLKNAAHKK